MFFYQECVVSDDLVDYVQDPIAFFRYHLLTFSFTFFFMILSNDV